MFEYRVTKYDPALRDGDVYTKDEWTSSSDIGRYFGGVVLTREQYQRVEDAYVAAALDFLREAGVPTLTVVGLENHRRSRLPPAERSILSLEQVGETIRWLLREEFWCRLEGPGSFVHVGYDYYMYVGVPQACPRLSRKPLDWGCSSNLLARRISNRATLGRTRGPRPRRRRHA